MDFITKGAANAQIIIVTSPQDAETYSRGKCLNDSAAKLFAQALKMRGIDTSVLKVISPPPLQDPEATESVLRKEAIARHESLRKEIEAHQVRPKLIVALGKWASMILTGQKVEFMKVRGLVQDVCTTMRVSDDTQEYDRQSCMFITSPESCVVRPDNIHMLEADLDAVKNILAGVTSKTYEFGWLEESKLDALLENPPKVICNDTETPGLDHRCPPKPFDGPLITTLSWDGVSGWAIPLSYEYCQIHGTGHTKADVLSLRKKFGALLDRVQVVGHNYKYDMHWLKRIGISVPHFYLDTIISAACIDENALRKSLDVCARRWAPGYAAYLELCNELDDSDMMGRFWEIPLRKALEYACGDVVTGFQIAKAHVEILAKGDAPHRRQWEVIKQIKMPAIRNIFFQAESEGALLDTDGLSKLGTDLETERVTLEKTLLEQIPPEILRKHQDNLSLTRDALIRDVLFDDEDGFGYEPEIFTSKTGLASVGKKGLAYIEGCDFVEGLKQYSVVEKMLSTYVGHPSGKEENELEPLKSGRIPKRIQDKFPNFHGENTEDENEHGRCFFREGRIVVETTTPPSGFWKYLREGGRIFPSYHLHVTNTMRTSSSGPSFQNLPKRGKFAELFRKLFKAKEGKLLVSCDLSQAELRIIAWESMDKAMLEIFRNGGDIHSMTAAQAMGVSYEEFCRLLKHGTEEEKETAKSFRTKAKSSNFGLPYGMSWGGYQRFAKTDYGITLSDKDAKQTRSGFFDTYQDLFAWHDRRKSEAHRNGFVQSLHGQIRRLPMIHSNDRAMVAQAERQAVNAPVQCFGSDMAMLGMHTFLDGAPKDKVRPYTFIHDDASLEVSEDFAEEAASGLKWCMENLPLQKYFGITPPLPIVSDASIGKSLGELKGVDIEAVKPSWVKV